MTYKNIGKCLDGHWEKPWHELPDEQRRAWREALVINFDEQDAGRWWDGYTLKQRRGVAESYDSQHDPAREGERRMAWHDVTLHAAMWWKRASVKPDEAAKLLCRLDPLKGEDPELIFVDGDESSPDRYRVLLRVFNDVAETVPKARTLLDWLCVAQREGLRYHSWIDEYARGMELAEATAAKVEAATVTSPSGDDWKKQARVIADECFDHDTEANPPVRDSLATKNSVRQITGGYCFRVMEIMQKRGIKGPRGIINNPGTVMRDALQGDKWWANKSK